MREWKYLAYPYALFWKELECTIKAFFYANVLLNIPNEILVIWLVSFLR